MFNYDLVVVGGGLTGVAAAYAAAREGLKVLLVEKSGYLGGAACNNYVNPFMRYTIIKDKGREVINKGIFYNILTTLSSMGGLHENKVTFNEEFLKIILDRMLAEKGVDVLFHSYLIETKNDDGKIQNITVANKSGKQEFSAKYFIDCTGDADLAALAGCPYAVGRESDGLCQPMTLCFRLANVDLDKVFANTRQINALYQEYQQSGKIKNPREDVLKFQHTSDGVLHLNSTRIIKHSPLDSFEKSVAESKAREQMYELFIFLKENIEGFENCTLLASAPEIGVRESRMIVGEYQITGEDLLSCTKFEDSIACGSYEIDIHSPDGTGTLHKQMPKGEYYTIPYRALVPQNTTNLLVAGRCISSTHEAQSSYRIIPTCCSIGEGAGIAVSVAFKSSINVKDVNIKEVHLLMDEYDAMY